MPRISEMPVPAPLTGLELIPALQGGGVDGSIGIPLLVANPAFGGAVLALRVPMEADMSGTSEADPGAGAIRWDNLNPHLATELYVSDDDGDAGDLAALFATLQVGGFVYVQGSTDSDARDNLQRWQVTSIDAESGYTKLGVSLQASGGAFTDDDPLEFTVQQPAPSPGVDRNVLTPAVSSAGALVFDASLGDYFTTTLSEDVTALTISNVPLACSLGFWLTQDASPHDVTWPASFNWGDGATPPSMPTDPGAVLYVVVSTNNAGGTWDASGRIRA